MPRKGCASARPTLMRFCGLNVTRQRSNARHGADACGYFAPKMSLLVHGRECTYTNERAGVHAYVFVQVYFVCAYLCAGVCKC